MLDELLDGTASHAPPLRRHLPLGRARRGPCLVRQASCASASRLDVDRRGPRFDVHEIRRRQFNLQDRGYLARVHPLELWLRRVSAPESRCEPAAGRRREPRTSVRPSTSGSSRARRRQPRTSASARSSKWKRSREIHKHWKRLGYPFGSLVPSYATAIGVSGDRPAALAELMGIIVNEGVRLPTSRIEELHFAAQTPYETVVRRAASSRSA